MSERLSIGNTEDKILKCKMIEESELGLRKESKNITPTTQTTQADSKKGKLAEETEAKLHKKFKVITPSVESRALLTLKLGNNTKPNFNLIENGEHSSSSKNVIAEVMHEEPKEFPCLFCNKKFLSSQALGGHQNAHKRERVIKKNEQKRMEEEMNSNIRFRPNFSYTYPYLSSLNYQGFPYLQGNFQRHTDTYLNNIMPSWLDSLSGGYGGMHMSNTLSLSPSFVMPKPTLTTLQFGMTNCLGENQTYALPISQRPNAMELGLFDQVNQTSSSGEGEEGSFNAQTRDFIGECQLLAEANVSSSSIELTVEELDLNLKL